MPNWCQNVMYLKKYQDEILIEEIKKGNFILSSPLKSKIMEKIAKKEQVILLLNRRGYSSMLTCSNCGTVEKCPNCDISLTYT